MTEIQHKQITGLDAAHPPFYASEGDPGNSLGAYRGWIKPSTGAVKIRNAANTDWIALTTNGAGGGGGGAYMWEPVRCATDQDFPLSAPGPIIDGIVMTAGDRVLVWLQDTPSENGIYVWNGAAALGFYLTLAVFPAMIFVMALLPYLPIAHVDQAIMDLLRQALPPRTAEMFSGVVQEVGDKGAEGWPAVRRPGGRGGDCGRACGRQQAVAARPGGQVGGRADRERTCRDRVIDVDCGSRDRGGEQDAGTRLRHEGCRDCRRDQGVL